LHAPPSVVTTKAEQEHRKVEALQAGFAQQQRTFQLKFAQQQVSAQLEANNAAPRNRFE
jgi:hypothetical protein